MKKQKQESIASGKYLLWMSGNGKRHNLGEYNGVQSKSTIDTCETETNGNVAITKARYRRGCTEGGRVVEDSRNGRFREYIVVECVYSAFDSIIVLSPS